MEMVCIPKLKRDAIKHDVKTNLGVGGIKVRVAHSSSHDRKASNDKSPHKES